MSHGGGCAFDFSATLKAVITQKVVSTVQAIILIVMFNYFYGAKTIFQLFLSALF